MMLLTVANYNRISEWPLQFLRTGFYSRSYGYLAGLTAHGHWWSDSAESAIYGHDFGTRPSNVYVQNNNWRGYGFALCCGQEVFIGFAWYSIGEIKIETWYLFIA